jgi:hypothetical protein
LELLHSQSGCGNALFACGGFFSVHFPPKPTRIPRISHQSPSILDLVLTNVFHEICDLLTSTVLFSDHLLVLFGVELNVRRKVPVHFVFDYKYADWVLFRRELDSRMDLNFSLHRVEYGADVDSIIQTFTEVIWRRELLRFLIFVQVVSVSCSPRK